MHACTWKGNLIGYVGMVHLITSTSVYCIMYTILLYIISTSVHNCTTIPVPCTYTHFGVDFG